MWPNIEWNLACTHRNRTKPVSRRRTSFCIRLKQKLHTSANWYVIFQDLRYPVICNILPVEISIPLWWNQELVRHTSCCFETSSSSFFKKHITHSTYSLRVKLRERVWGAYVVDRGGSRVFANRAVDRWSCIWLVTLTVTAWQVSMNHFCHLQYVTLV